MGKSSKKSMNLEYIEYTNTQIKLSKSGYF